MTNLTDSLSQKNNESLLSSSQSSLSRDSHVSLGTYSLEESSLQTEPKVTSLAQPIIKTSAGTPTTIYIEQSPSKRGYRLSVPTPLDITFTDTLPKKEVEAFVTTEMIERWNDEIGNDKNPKKVKKLIDRMRQLGGLDSSELQINIPSARLGLCLLAQYKHDQKIKMYALESLLEILKNDNYCKENAYRLINLSIDLLKLIHREVIQTEDLDTQVKLTEVYKVLAETLHIHAGKKHFNGITEDTKKDLINAANSVELLNRIDDNKINFNISCTRQWLKKLRSDRQELFIIIESIYNLILSGGAIYLEDAEEAFDRLEQSFESIKLLQSLPKHPWHWYNSLLILKSLARDIKLHNLAEFQTSAEAKVHNNAHLKFLNSAKSSHSELPKLSESPKPIIIQLDSTDTKHNNLIISESTEISEIVKKPNFALMPLLMLIHKKHAKLSWKFSYGAIETLYDIVLNGKTPEIRMQAFKGMSFRGKNKNNKEKAIILPGLAHFASCTEIKKTAKFKNMVHLHLPEVVNSNEITRSACVEHLIMIIEKSTDKEIVRKSIKILNRRLIEENDKEIREKLLEWQRTQKTIV